jgi:hypothetical protein
MQDIFTEDRDQLEKSFADLKKQQNNKHFKFEVLLAFWLCVHLEKLESA